MVFNRKLYEKLSGNSLLSVQSSFLGSDHILIVNGRYTERYRQLYYKDIEAILVTHTRTGLVVGIVCFMLGLVFGLLAISESRSAGFWPLVICCVISVWVMIIQIYGKGSSVFGIKTAVQTVIVTGLNTRRRVGAAEEILANKIESVQGRLSIDELRAAIESAREQESRKNPSTITSPPPLIQKPAEADRELDPDPND